jgi:hypothetical protein
MIHFSICTALFIELYVTIFYFIEIFKIRRVVTLWTQVMEELIVMELFLLDEV